MYSPAVLQPTGDQETDISPCCLAGLLQGKTSVL